MVTQNDIVEGKVPFEHASLPRPAETWYQILGKLDNSSTRVPLVVLHGGPGACHGYLGSMKELANTHGIAMVLYDQVGCGKSTHFKETRYNRDVWRPELFIAELESLLKHLKISKFDLLGQSWGGMLAASYAVTQPAKLRKLIISNAPASMDLWIESCDLLRSQLPRDINDTLTKYEELKEFQNPEFRSAMMVFYKRHLCRVDGEDGSPFPEDLMGMMKDWGEDDTTSMTMTGPSELSVAGSLEQWSVVGKLGLVKNKTLILSGEFDKAQPDSIMPFATEIQNNTWKVIPDASHMSHIEKPEEYCQIVAEFLKSD